MIVASRRTEQTSSVNVIVAPGEYGATFFRRDHVRTSIYHKRSGVAVLSIRCLDGGSAQEFPVECPYCGDTRGKCSFCVSKNGEIKNVFHCFHCGQGGNMLTLYADIMGFYGADRCKEAYQDIRNGWNLTGR